MEPFHCVPFCMFWTLNCVAVSRILPPPPKWSMRNVTLLLLFLLSPVQSSEGSVLRCSFCTSQGTVLSVTLLAQRIIRPKQHAFTRWGGRQGQTPGTALCAPLHLALTEPPRSRNPTFPNVSPEGPSPLWFALSGCCPRSAGGWLRSFPCTAWRQPATACSRQTQPFLAC